MLEQKYTENQLVLQCSIIGAQSQGRVGNVRAKVYWRPIGAALRYHNNHKAS